MAVIVPIYEPNEKLKNSVSKLNYIDDSLSDENATLKRLQGKAMIF